MPYPMFRHPTFREISVRLKDEFQCCFREIGKCLDDDRTMWRIDRQVNGESKVRRYFLVIENLDDRLTRTRLLSVCRHFSIPPTFFDLNLD